MAVNYVKGTQNHLDIVPVADAAAGSVVPAAECPDLMAVYTRPYVAGANGAAAYSGVFRVPTALTASTIVGTRVDINDAGTAIAGAGGRGGCVTRQADGTTVEVAINVDGVA